MKKINWFKQKRKNQTTGSEVQPRPVIKNEISTERSGINDRLPKYYNGFDVDVILQKYYEKKDLSDKEFQIFRSVVDDYYDKECQKTCEDGFISLLKIYDRGVYPNASVVGTPYWNSVFPDNSQKDVDLEEEIEEIEGSELNEWMPRYFEGQDIDNILRKEKHGTVLSKEEDLLLCRALEYYQDYIFKKRDLAWRKSVKKTLESGHPYAQLMIHRRIDLTLTMPSFNFYVRDENDI